MVAKMPRFRDQMHCIFTRMNKEIEKKMIIIYWFFFVLFPCGFLIVIFFLYIYNSSAERPPVDGREAIFRLLISYLIGIYCIYSVDYLQAMLSFWTEYTMLTSGVGPPWA